MGLQWGALAWLSYLLVRCANDVSSKLAAQVWLCDSTLKLASLILAGVLLLAGSRWARASVGLAIVVQLAPGIHEVAQRWDPDLWREIGVSSPTIRALDMCGVEACLPLIPLVLWRIDRQRVALALLAMGRGRAAWERAGGAVAALAALPMLALNHATVDLLRFLEPAWACAVVGALAIVRYGEVIVAWPLKGRQGF